MKNGKNLSKYKIIKSFFINLLATIFIFIFLFNFLKNNYAINRSSSITQGIYKLHPINSLNKGDIVVFDVNNDIYNYMLGRSYINKYTVAFIKKIAGVPNDTIELNKDLIINGQIIKRDLPKVDSLGRELPLIQGKFKLKEDEYFLIGTHIRSFDSSYMGIVKKDQIKNKAELIFSFENEAELNLIKE